MAGPRRRIRTGLLAFGVAALVVTLSACNPLVNQTTRGSAGFPPFIPASSSTGRLDFTGTEPGWIEIQVIDATSPAVAVTGAYRYADRPDCGSLPPTWVWSEGSSLGFQRLVRVEPGAQFFLTTQGSSDPIRYNVRVVDDGGQPVGDVTPYVPPAGQFEEVGWAIC